MRNSGENPWSESQWWKDWISLSLQMRQKENISNWYWCSTENCWKFKKSLDK
jgi:hypothetical protein